MPNARRHPLWLATAEAWPLASIGAFRSGLLHLERTRGGGLDAVTDRLGVDLEGWLRPRCSGASLDDLRGARDIAWFDGCGQPEQRVTMSAHLTRIASRYLDVSAGQAVVRAHPDRVTPLRRWRWISLFLPSDLLVAACAAPSGAVPRSDHPELGSPQLRRVLERGVGETHLHLGAAFGFSTIWSAWMGCLANGEASITELEALGVLVEAPIPIGQLMASAAIARLALAAWLEAGAGAGSTRVETTFDSDSDLRMRLCLHRALSAIDRGTKPPPLQALRKLHLRLVLRGTVDGRGDPLAAWLGEQPGWASVETRFLVRLLSALEGAERAVVEGTGDGVLRRRLRLGWQYIRSRNLIFRHLTIEAGTEGLDWFQRHYDRMRRFRAPLRGDLMPAAIAHESRELTLRSLEVRDTPEDRWDAEAKLLRKIVGAATRFDAEQALRPGHKPLEIGLVVHFLKMRGKDDLSRPPHSRYGAWVLQQERRVAALRRLLRLAPEALVILRGVDVAGAERAIPTWPTIGPLHAIRSFSHEASARLRLRYPSWDVPPLRATYHAGEDFSRLASGLRQMHELVEYRVLSAGDRIGHGLALTVDIDRWVDGYPAVDQPVEERLSDLTWELAQYRRGFIDPPEGRWARVVDEAQQLARRVFGEPVEVEAMVHMRDLLHEPRLLGSLGYPHMRSVSSANRGLKLLDRYLRDSAVAAELRRTLTVRATEGERAMLRRAQDALREAVSRLEITIETNPSSNWLIRDASTLSEHPAINLGAGGSHPQVLCSISSDDPLTFATHLAAEHGWLLSGLREHGMSVAEALARVDEIRRHGLRSRFTLEESAMPDVRQKILRALGGRR